MNQILFTDDAIHGGCTDAAVHDALARHGDLVKARGRGRWEVGLANGALHPGTARLDFDCLVLEFAADTDASVPGDDWDLLRCNAAAGPGIKTARPRLNEPVRVRGELCLDGVDPEAVDTRVQRLLGSLRPVLDTLHGGKPGIDRDPRHSGPDPDRPADEPSAAQLCRGSGWPFRERSGHLCSVRLDTARGTWPARIETGGTGGDGPALASVVLAESLSADDPCGLAVARLLNDAGACVRLVRPAALTIIGDGDGPAALTVRLESSLPPGASGPDLARGLEALCVGCAWLASETRLLGRDRELASEYLRGCSSDAPANHALFIHSGT